MRKAILVAASLALFSFPAYAADEPAASPAPPAGAVKLHDLVGHWTGLGEMTEPGKETQTMTVVVNCIETSGGWGIRCDDTMTGKDVNYLETDLMGYDAQENKVHWYAVTNAGEVHDHVAQWKDDKTLLATHTEKPGGKSIDENITLTLATPTSMEVKSTLSVDGQESQSMTMTLAKSGTEKK